MTQSSSGTLGTVKTLMIVSAITHFLMAFTLIVSTIFTCFTFVLGVFPIVVGILELVFISKIDQVTPHEASEKTKLYGILDIVAGATSCNPIPIVLGILNITYAPKILEEAGLGSPMPGAPVGMAPQQQPYPGPVGQPAPPVTTAPPAPPAAPVDAPIDFDATPPADAAPPTDPAPPASPEAPGTEDDDFKPSA